MREVAAVQGHSFTEAKKTLYRIEIKKKKLEMLLAKRTRELMSAQGCLSMKGVIGE